MMAQMKEKRTYINYYVDKMEQFCTVGRKQNEKSYKISLKMRKDNHMIQSNI